MPHNFGLYNRLDVSTLWVPSASVPTELPVFRKSAYKDVWTTHQPSRQNVPEGTIWVELLEFVGDAIYHAVTNHIAVTEFPNESPGSLTVATQPLLTNKQQAVIATHLKIPEHIKSSERKKFVKGRSDALEVLVGALMLDSGWSAVATFLKPVLKPGIEFFLKRHKHRLLIFDLKKDSLLSSSRSMASMRPSKKRKRDHDNSEDATVLYSNSNMHTEVIDLTNEGTNEESYTSFESYDDIFESDSQDSSVSDVDNGDEGTSDPEDTNNRSPNIIDLEGEHQHHRDTSEVIDLTQDDGESSDTEDSFDPNIYAP